MGLSTLDSPPLYTENHSFAVKTQFSFCACVPEPVVSILVMFCLPHCCHCSVCPCVSCRKVKNKLENDQPILKLLVQGEPHPNSKSSDLERMSSKRWRTKQPISLLDILPFLKNADDFTLYISRLLPALSRYTYWNGSKIS